MCQTQHPTPTLHLTIVHMILEKWSSFHLGIDGLLCGPRLHDPVASEYFVLIGIITK